MSWPTYADWPNAPVYPAGGNLDGAGGDELVLGLGSRGGGWSQVWTYNGSTLVPYGGTPVGGGWVLLDWAGYNASGNAPIYPACGDLDRDGKDDLVLGLGTVGAGWFQVLHSTGTTLSPMAALAGGWGRIPWTGYASSGDAASYPACGDLDGDTRDDLVVGLGNAGYGWAYVLSGGSFSPPAWSGWVQVNWPGYSGTRPSPVFPAVAHGHGAILTSIDVTPTNPSLARGTSQQLTATGHFSDGTVQDVTASVDWRSSDGTKVGVSPAGLASALEVGSADAIAECMGVEGSTTVTVTPATLSRIEVTPTNPSVPDGLTRQFTATGVFTDNTTQDLTSQATWSSTNESAATVASGGLATAVDPGTSDIQASFGGQTGQTTMTVTAAELVSIQVTPTTPSVPDGLTRQFAATGIYTDNSTQDLTELAAWNSTNVAAATVSNLPGSRGLATAIDPGQTDISATVGAVTGQTTLTVTAAELVSIQVTPTNPSIPDGLTQQFTATGPYTDNSTQDLTDTATWASSNASAATVSNAAGSRGLATSVDPGQSDISATVGAVSNSTRLTVTAAELVSIQVTPTNPSIPDGLTRQFTATGTYTDNSTQDLTDTATWASSNPSAATVSNAAGSRGLATSVDPGQSDISATVSTLSGSTGLTVTAAILQSIEVTPSNSVMPATASRYFRASGHYSDGAVNDVTNACIWASTDTSVAEAYNGTEAGLVQTWFDGTTSIRATLGAVTGSTSLTVRTDLDQVLVGPPDIQVIEGLTQQYVATGVFSDGFQLDMTDLVDWTATTGMSFQTPAQPGLATALEPAFVDIRARFSFLEGTTTAEVVPAQLVSIQVSPTGPSIPNGYAQNFVAVGTYSNGTTRNITGSVTWSVDDTTVATVSNAYPTRGRCLGLQPGQSVVRATQGTLSESTQITVTGSSLTSIDVNPVTASLGIGETLDYVATGHFSDGSSMDLTQTVTWNSTVPTVATVSSSFDPGRASALANGSTAIQATIGSVTGQADLTVGPPVLTRLKVLPANTAISQCGGTESFRVIAHYSDGGIVDRTASAVWMSTNAAVASVDSNGLVTPLGLGTTTIQAEFGGLQGTTGLEVTDEVRGHYAQLLPVGTGKPVATADLNLDHRPDVVTTSSSTVYTLLGLGDGTFQASFSWVFGTVGPVAVGDVDADGRPDLCVVNGSKLSVLRGLGTGSFESPVDFPLSLPGSGITAADFNRDGFCDVAVGLNSSNQVDTVQLHYGGPGESGGWSLTPGIILSTVVSQGPVQLVASDLDGDGWLDLAVGFQGAGNIAVFMAPGAGGNPVSRLIAAAAVSDLKVSDLTNDGIPDIAASEYNDHEVLTLVGNGDGTFRDLRFVDVVDRAEGVSVGHLDGDALPDLAVSCAGNRLKVLKGQGDGTVSAQSTFLAPYGLCLLGDFVQDGWADLIVGGSSSVLAPGSGSGLVAARRFRSESTNERRTRFADLNGDGHLDFVLASSDDYPTIYIGDGLGSFQEFDSGIPVVGTHDLGLADLDGEGHQDLVLPEWGNPGEVHIWLGRGDGTFTFRQTLNIAVNPKACFVGDVNGDGLLDVVTLHHSDQVSICLGNGDGTLQSPLFHTVPPYPTSLAGGDVNGDGRLDLMGTTSNWVWQALGNGDGTFGTTQILQGYVSQPDGIVLQDLDGNTYLDYVVTVWASGLAYSIGNGDGTYQSPVVLQLPEDGPLTAADVTCDGRVDLICNGRFGLGIQIMGQLAGGGFGPAHTLPGSAWAGPVSVADVNEDGEPDLITVDAVVIVHR
ncbi:MAG: Ig-like domain-containing protein [Candidatus Eremiobacterota bacterium]